MPMKNCAAKIASDGGRLCRNPARVTAAVAMSGPRIDAPKRPARRAAHQPKAAQAIMSRSSCSGTASKGHAGRILEVRVPDSFQDERQGNDDDENPRGVNERKGADVCARFFAEGEHFLKAAGHGGIVRRRHVVSAESPEEGGCPSTRMQITMAGTRARVGHMAGNVAITPGVSVAPTADAEHGAHGFVERPDPTERNACKCGDEAGEDGGPAARAAAGPSDERRRHR